MSFFRKLHFSNRIKARLFRSKKVQGSQHLISSEPLPEKPLVVLDSTEITHENAHEQETESLLPPLPVEDGCDLEAGAKDFSNRPCIFDLPNEIVSLICTHLALKTMPVGSPDTNGEVTTSHFKSEYRQYRALNFARASRKAYSLVNHIFFALNTFEFHYAHDYEKFLLSVADEQRNQVLKLRFFSSMTQPFTQTYAQTNPGSGSEAHHFPQLSEDELVKATHSFQNALVLTKACNRLQSLEIYYRYQIHAEALIRPASTAWEGAWTRHYTADSAPRCAAQSATWDYIHTGALQCLRGGSDEDCEFDFENPIPNELADRIDKFIESQDVEVETYHVEPDCDDIVNDVVAARDRASVLAADSCPKFYVREYVCSCCDGTIWKKEAPVDTHFGSLVCCMCTDCCSDRVCRRDPAEVWRASDANKSELVEWLCDFNI